VLSITASRYDVVVSTPGVVAMISSKDVVDSWVSVVENNSSVEVSAVSVVV